MTDVILESVRAIVLLGIVVFLWNAGRRKFQQTRKGWNLIIIGFSLLLMGSLVDITDNFEELNRFVISGDTPTEDVLEKFVGFLGGFCILAIGLVKWIPSVQKLSDEIAERKQVEKELLKTQLDLQKTLAKEQDLNKLQQQFVSMASHEFRTPLAIIDTAAQRMKRRADENRLTPEEAVQRVDKIRDAVGRMTQLMESTLNTARMEEGKFKVKIKPCDIGKVVREVCVRQQEISKSHVISFDLADLPFTIQADTDSLEQVLTNLLSNAVKYAPDAPNIEVKTRREGHQVVISVRDHGIGIDTEDLHRIGERFFRAKTSTGIVGTGIGLNLVRTLVEMHGGTMSLDSKKGEGSTFTVHLPIAGPDKLEQPEASVA